MNKVYEIHEKALAAAKRYRSAEIELIEILQEVGKHRVFYHLNYNSLFQYAVQALGLSEQVAYLFINVSRKASDVPQLKEDIRSGLITVSKALTISSVLTPDNQNHWLGIARSSSKRQLEREVAIASPIQAVREQTRYTIEPVDEGARILNLPEVFVELKVGVPERTMLKLRYAQDLVSKSMRSHATLVQTLQALVDFFLERKDPLAKAKRAKLKGRLPNDIPKTPDANVKKLFPGIVNVDAASSQDKPHNKREPFSAAVKNQVYLKDDGQCAHIDKNGKRCNQRRHLDIHHIKPVAKGGTNEIENLTLLCRGHHRALHIADAHHDHE